MTAQCERPPLTPVHPMHPAYRLVLLPGTPQSEVDRILRDKLVLNNVRALHVLVG